MRCKITLWCSAWVACCLQANGNGAGATAHWYMWVLALITSTTGASSARCTEMSRSALSRVLGRTGSSILVACLPSSAMGF